MKNVQKGPMIVILSAPSGAGKTTLCQKLVTEFEKTLRLSISCTTRQQRGDEIPGLHYFFITTEDFKAKITRGEFVEWAEVHGNLYGTLRTTVEEYFSQGFSALLDIDVQGARSLRQAFGGRCMSIFITPPDFETLEKRLRARGTEPEELIAKRLNTAKSEMQHAKDFDYVVVNDNLEKAYKKLREIVLTRIKLIR